MTELTIIIVSYNVRLLLLDCLNSIFNNIQGISVQVIVVDNASNDNSAESVKELFKNVQLIENKKNTGFPAANNQALKFASGRYILLLNPDAEIKGDALQKMLLYMETHTDIQILGPKLTNTDGSFQQSYWRFPTFWNVTAEMFYLGKLFNHKNYPEQNLTHPFKVDSISGAALLFRKELLQTVGVLDENLFWIEDIDFCYRAKIKGNEIEYFPEAEVIHHIGQSAKKDYRISLSNQVFNKIKFFKKHYSPFSTFCIKVVSLIHCIIKLIMFTLISPFNTIAGRKASAYFYTLPKIFNPPATIE